MQNIKLNLLKEETKDVNERRRILKIIVKSIV